MSPRSRSTPVRTRGPSFVFVLFFFPFDLSTTDDAVRIHDDAGTFLRANPCQAKLRPIRSESPTLLKDVSWIARVKNLVARARRTCRLTFHDGSWFSWMRAATLGFPRDSRISRRYKRGNFPDKLDSRTSVLNDKKSLSNGSKSFSGERKKEKEIIFWTSHKFSFKHLVKICICVMYDL